MVVPGLYGYVSATKWLVDIEVTRFADFTAYWTDRGFDAEAPIKTFSRIDVPQVVRQARRRQERRRRRRVGADTAASRRSRSSVDDGAWQHARLADADGIDTWRQWVYEWDADPGSHRIAGPRDR